MPGQAIMAIPWKYNVCWILWDGITRVIWVIWTMMVICILWIVKRIFCSTKDYTIGPVRSRMPYVSHPMWWIVVWWVFSMIVLVMFLVLKKSFSKLTAQQIVEHVRDRLLEPQKQLHNGVYFVEKLPQNNNGKNLKRKATEVFKALISKSSLDR